MTINKLPQNPRIVLLANDWVGLEIVEYFQSRKEHVSALILHPADKAKLAKEIRAVFPRTSLFSADSLRDQETLAKIAGLEADLAISAWFGYILKPEFINIFPSGVINFHNSYLPVNRGKYPHVWAIAKGTKYGVTLHYIDEGIDTGAIIAQRLMKVKPTDIAGTLYDRALHELVELFQDTWPKICANKIRPIIQKGDDGTHHFAREVAELDFVDIEKTYKGEDLISQLRSRSFKDRSYAYFVKNGKKIYVKIELSEKPEFNNG